MEEGEVTLTDVESFEIGQECFIEGVTRERYVRKQVTTFNLITLFCEMNKNRVIWSHAFIDDIILSSMPFYTRICSS